MPFRSQHSRLHFAARPDGQVQVRMEPQIVAMLAHVMHTLNEQLPDNPTSLRDDSNVHPSLRRLFPVGHATDSKVAADYADMARPSLAQSQNTNFSVMRSTLRTLYQGDETTLDDDQTEAWVRGLNSLRLMLGTQLDVDAVAELPDSYDTDEDRDRLFYVYLTGMLDELLLALPD